MKDSSGASVAGARVKLVQAATGAQTNARFGEFTASRTPRIGQLALRLYF